MTKNKTFAMLAIACMALFSACSQQKAAEVTLQVKTQNGILEGFEQDGVKKFLGVPFAQAPVPNPFRLGRVFVRRSSLATTPCSSTFSAIWPSVVLSVAKTVSI